MAETTEHRHQTNKISESEVLIKVAQTASSALELREILDTISLIVASTLGKDICSICIFKPEKKVICVQAANNVERESINVFCLIDKDETINRMFGEVRAGLAFDAPPGCGCAAEVAVGANASVSKSVTFLNVFMMLIFRGCSTTVGVILLQRLSGHSVCDWAAYT